MMRSKRRLCLVQRIPGVAGPASFQRRIAMGLQARDIGISFDLEDTPFDAVLVIGATRRLKGLWRAKKTGIPILQRLNGMNWIHRRMPTGLQHYLRAEGNNLLLRWIRQRVANIVVYQSCFAQRWWERKYGAIRAPCHVVHNGVPLNAYHPQGPHARPEDRNRILVVEGNLAGGYEIGLEWAVSLAQEIQSEDKLTVELMVVGRVSEAIRLRRDAQSTIPIHWKGQVPPDAIPSLDRSAHVLYAADVNPACPNAVIEAMACGLPVVAFDTGALSEIVCGEAGKLVAYGGDPWKLEPPDLKGLSKATRVILEDQNRYRTGARAQAERAFGLDRMVDSYLEALGWG